MDAGNAGVGALPPLRSVQLYMGSEDVDSSAEHGPRHVSICVDRPDSYHGFGERKEGEGELRNKEESLLHTTYLGPHT